MIDLKNAILLVYTLVLFVLHFYGFVQLFVADAFDYPKMFQFLVTITSIQYLDIPFSFCLTKSNPLVVFVQVSGRILVLWVANQTTGWEPAVFTLVAVYLLSELCRGPFYIANCLGSPKKSLTWLRYNAFKVLYPIGFSCEALVFLNVFFVTNQIPISLTDRRFLLVLVFFLIFYFIVNFLYSSMSRKAAQKNAELAGNKRK